MLNKKSMPVWMLADGLLMLLSGGGLFCCSLALVLLPSWVSREELQQLTRDARRLPDVTSQVQERRQQLDKFRSLLDDREVVLARTEAALEAARQQADALRSDYNALLAESSQEKRIRQQMLGLRGSLDRTLFVIDISGSMNKAADRPMDRPNWGSDGKPWTFVCNQVMTWLELLPVESFRVICFDHRIEEFPAAGLGWVSGKESQDEVRSFLADTEPKGLTMTEKAIMRALEWSPTSIILFTDGAPTNARGEFDPQQIERLLQQDLPPINVVAVNNYFDERCGSLLHRLATRSNGSFIGL